jgi:uncharacterized membrane-anchored protein YhcB (DUF1043 family)
MIILQIEQAKELLSIEYVSVIGLLITFCAYLIWDRHKSDKVHQQEKEYLKEEIKNAQTRLNDEFKETNQEMKKVSENYHVFTTQVFDRLNNILNSKK